MKTPMQELIEQLNNVKPQDFCSIETIKGWAETMLEKEKEVIENAYWDGGQDVPAVGSRCEDYYNKTFNNDQ
jgi:hypothetical protein